MTRGRKGAEMWTIRGDSMRAELLVMDMPAEPAEACLESSDCDVI